VKDGVPSSLRMKGWLQKGKGPDQMSNRVISAYIVFGPIFP
jgi:hypothetical protein